VIKNPRSSETGHSNAAPRKCNVSHHQWEWSSAQFPSVRIALFGVVFLYKSGGVRLALEIFEVRPMLRPHDRQANVMAHEYARKPALFGP